MDQDYKIKCPCCKKEFILDEKDIISATPKKGDL